MQAVRYSLVGLLIAESIVFIAFYTGEHGSAPDLAPLRLLFVGDMMFDRSIRTVGDARGYDFLFSCIEGYLKGFDAVIGNLEGPITYASSKSSGTKPGQEGNTTFTFSPAIVPALAAHRFAFVDLGNNHIADFGKEGVESTVQALSDGGIASFDAWGKETFATSTIKGVRIALVGFDQFLGDDPQKAIDAVASLRSSNDFVAVFAHWGDEYVPETEAQKALAHAFIDAGADLVVGSHPHVAQATEIYKGKPIYYSLGNFIFDQYWQESVRRGEGVETTIAGGVATSSVVSFFLEKDGRTCLTP